MSETKTPGEKKLSVSKLTLKPRTETGVVRQSFSHGRSKQVVVEKVKRRFGPAETKAEPPVVEAKKPAVAAPKPAARPAAATPGAAAPAKSGVVLRTLTDEERASISANVFFDDALHASLSEWVRRHYRDRLSPEDLADPAFARESMVALDALTALLRLGSVYDFQKA
jgi:hypothetical protein